MNIREGTERKVSFNTRDELGDMTGMRKDPSNPKYIKVEDRIGPIVKEVIRIEIVGQTAETEDNMEIIVLCKAVLTLSIFDTYLFI